MSNERIYRRFSFISPSQPPQRGGVEQQTENEILKTFKRLAHDENKCVIIVTHSKNVSDNADIVYDLKKDK